MNIILREIDLLKTKISACRPNDPHLFQQLREHYRISLTFASNALEGNSLTESDTNIVIRYGLAIGGKPLKDHMEVLGHSEAYDLLFRLAHHKDITEGVVKELHRLFYYRIELDQAGKYRDQKVIVTGANFVPPPPDRLPDLMKSFVEGIPGMRKKLHPPEFAAALHKDFVTIHPFIDGNGRVARLLMNLVLLQAGYPIVVIPPATRREYLLALDKTHTGDDRPFMDFIAGACHESAKEYFRLLTGGFGK